MTSGRAHAGNDVKRSSGNGRGVYAAGRCTEVGANRGWQCMGTTLRRSCARYSEMSERRVHVIGHRALESQTSRHGESRVCAMLLIEAYKQTILS